MAFVAVCCGGFLGAISRSTLSKWIEEKSAYASFPVGIMVVNWLGCFVLGLLVRNESFLHDETSLFLMTGTMDAFTTFSTFSIEAITFMETKSNRNAIIYVLLSVGGWTWERGFATY